MPGIHVKKITSGEKLQQKLREIAAIKAQAKVGFFDRATYTNGTSVAYVAYLNEYGGHNPRRPFMKHTARKNIKKWVLGIKKNIKMAGMSRANVKRAYERAAVVAVGDVKKTIKAWPPGGNKESTVKAKARRARSGKNLQAINPETVLIDTGQMIGAVSYEVKV